MIPRACLLALLVMLSPRAALAEFGWQPDAKQRALLARGEIVVDVKSGDEATRAPVRAAVSIAQPPAVIYRAMTSCTQAIEYVPNLSLCQVLETAADRQSEVIEHVVDFGWYLPAQRYVFRAQYVEAQRIAFELVRGDLRDLRGVWSLLPASNGGATIVTYQVRIQPKARVPQWLVRRNLRRELPALLAALREHVNDRARRADHARE
jgi:ribosome-associated toxin RatA of RatAB toxin-antitoxin module